MTEYTKIVRTDKDIPSAINWVEGGLENGIQSAPVIITLGREKRTNLQNDKLWPMLRDISKQVEWYGEYLTEREWKDVFTAALKKQRGVPGVDGGFVMLGQSTSNMPKELFSDLIELIYSFGAEKNIIWSEPSLKVYEGYHV
jgi:hypothetical protein